MENMFELFQVKPDVANYDPNAPDLDPHQGAGIHFQNVHFAYSTDRDVDDVQKPVLKGVDFSLEPGKTLAVVGPSGSGKSTVMKLLFRFYDPSDGQILVDGQNTKFVDLDSVRSLMGVVPQETTLCSSLTRCSTTSSMGRGMPARRRSTRRPDLQMSTTRYWLSPKVT